MSETLVLPPLLYIFTLGRHLEDEYRNASAEIRAIDTRVEQAKSAQRKLPQFHDEFRRITEDSAKLRTILPTTPDFDVIRENVTVACAAAGIRLTLFDPQPPGRTAPQDPYREIHMNAEVLGSAVGTAAFFRIIESESRIIDIPAVNMRAEGDQWRSRFVMTSYVETR